MAREIPLPAWCCLHEVLVEVGELFHVLGQGVSNLGKFTDPIDGRAAMETNEALGIHGWMEIIHLKAISGSGR